MKRETVLLEELQTADGHHVPAAKVDKVHLHLSRAGDVMDDGPVEPHSFGRHAADLAASDKRQGEAVRLRNLWEVVASSWGRNERKKRDRQCIQRIPFQNKLQAKKKISY